MAGQKSWDVACLGELVMDLVPHSRAGEEWLYAPSPGGAPGNVAAGLARLGRRAAMLGKLGADPFGSAILAALAKHGVDTRGVVSSAAVKTALSVVTLAPDGERAFSFYRESPAELAIDLDEAGAAIIADSRILHLGVLPLSAPRSAAAQRQAILVARENGAWVSADPNFRPGLWPDQATMLAAGRELVGAAQIVKLGAEELFALAGTRDIAAAACALWHPELRLMAVTKGAAGADLISRQCTVSCAGFPVASIDTTAAGDSFMAALLSQCLERDLDDLNPEQMSDMLRRACAAGALATTAKGAMASLPDNAAIGKLLGG